MDVAIVLRRDAGLESTKKDLEICRRGNNLGATRNGRDRLMNKERSYRIERNESNIGTAIRRMN